MGDLSEHARTVAQRAARTAYGKLLAVLAVRTRDVQAAEDALAAAFVEALETWPASGIPDAPEAWLLTAARNNLTDETRRRRAAHTQSLSEVSVDSIHRLMWTVDPAREADERLTMLFVCAHPAIDKGVRTALMLQAVLGVTAQQLAAAFVTSPTLISQRLVRAKRRLKDTGIRFDRPEPHEFQARADDVLDAVYGAFGLGYDGLDTIEHADGSLAADAIDLSAIITDQLPEMAEGWGLRALMLLCHARRNARRDAHGVFVPIHEQDTTRWDLSLLAAGNFALLRASALRFPGRFQTEAAIQSAQMDGILQGQDHRNLIANLYDVLAAQSPTIGVQVARAAAWSEAGCPDVALTILSAIEHTLIATYQPYWAVRADVHRRLGQSKHATADYQMAIGLTSDPGLRTWLVRRAESLER